MGPFPLTQLSDNLDSDIMLLQVATYINMEGNFYFINQDLLEADLPMGLYYE